ncbi:putative protein without homology [Propionibacterium freudenreichii subsp. shermanii]|nr:putative protein without homology [Propionibacterium freudenreichii subsp. shermanii]
MWPDLPQGPGHNGHALFGHALFNLMDQDASMRRPTDQR